MDGVTRDEAERILESTPKIVKLKVDKVNSNEKNDGGRCDDYVVYI